jgi:ABC-type transporter Mla subunit MlaD
MSNRSATYTLYLNSNVQALLRMTEQQALSLDKTMSNLQHTLNAVGIGLGLRELIQTAKEWVNVAAEYETSTLRIKNNSESLTEGLKNQKFIYDETV